MSRETLAREGREEHENTGTGVAISAPRVKTELDLKIQLYTQLTALLNEAIKQASSVTNSDSVRQKALILAIFLTLVLPQLSVPACLASLAFWGGAGKWGEPFPLFSPLVYVLCGGIVGGAYGIASLLGTIFGAQAQFNKIKESLALIRSVGDCTRAMECISSQAGYDGNIGRHFERLVNSLPKKLPPATWTQIVNALFACFTAFVTSFVFSGIIRFAAVSEDNRTRNDRAYGLSFGATWGVAALLFAYYGQRAFSQRAKFVTVLQEIVDSLNDFDLPSFTPTASVDVAPDNSEQVENDNKPSSFCDAVYSCMSASASAVVGLFSCCRGNGKSQTATELEVNWLATPQQPISVVVST